MGKIIIPEYLRLSSQLMMNILWFVIFLNFNSLYQSCQQGLSYISKEIDENMSFFSDIRPLRSGGEPSQIIINIDLFNIRYDIINASGSN